MRGHAGDKPKPNAEIREGEVSFVREAGGPRDRTESGNACGTVSSGTRWSAAKPGLSRDERAELAYRQTLHI